MRHVRGIVVPLLCTLALNACGSAGGGGDVMPPAEPPQGTAVEAPLDVSGLTEQHFAAWLEHGGQDATFTAWFKGGFGPGSIPSTVKDGATPAERQEAFATWLSEPKHRSAVVRRWLQAEQGDAKARLRDALAASRVYAAAHAHTFDGLSIGALKRIEPGLRYGVGPGRYGVVTLRAITPASVLLVTRTPDGGAVCVSMNNGGDVGYGWVDPQVYADCVDDTW